MTQTPIEIITYHITREMEYAQFKVKEARNEITEAEIETIPSRMKHLISPMVQQSIIYSHFHFLAETVKDLGDDEGSIMDFFKASLAGLTKDVLTRGLMNSSSLDSNTVDLLDFAAKRYLINKMENTIEYFEQLTESK